MASCSAIAIQQNTAVEIAAGLKDVILWVVPVSNDVCYIGGSDVSPALGLPVAEGQWTPVPIGLTISEKIYAISEVGAMEIRVFKSSPL